MKGLNRNSKSLLLGQALSFMGDYCALPALLVLSTLYNDVWMTTGVIICRSVPTIFQPFIGVFVDRLNKINVMFWTDILRGIVFGIIFFIPQGRFPYLFIIALFISYGAGVLFNPARLAIMTSLGDEIKRINTLFAKATTLFIMVGAFTGAILTLFDLVKYAIIINAVSYLYSAYLIKRIRLGATARKPALREDFNAFNAERKIIADFREGLLAIVGNSRVMNAVLTMLSMAFLWGIMYRYFPIVSKSLEIGNDNVGNFILTMLIGLGGFIGASIINHLGFNKKKGIVIFSLLAFISSSVFITSFGFIYCCIAALLFFMVMEYGEILSKVNVQENSSPYLQGRIFSISESLIGVFISLGSIVANFLSPHKMMILIFIVISILFLHSLTTIIRFDRKNKPNLGGDN
jgi:MFS transporter, DHA3 family, bacilysin exporter BacE